MFNHYISSFTFAVLVPYFLNDKSRDAPIITYTNNKGREEINAAVFRESKPPTNIKPIGSKISAKAQNKRCQRIGSLLMPNSSVAQDASA